MDAGELTAELDLTQFKHPDKFGEWMGYSVTEFSKEGRFAKSALKIRNDHLSPAGTVHGGVISGFFDFACGAAVFTTMNKTDFCSTVELKVNYLRPIQLGDDLLARTEVVFRGKKICVVHGFIYVNESEEPSAMVSATFNIVNTDKPTK